MTPSRWVRLILLTLFCTVLAAPILAQEVTEEATDTAVTPEETEVPAPVPTEIEFILYTVQFGDTLNRIAIRFNTTISILSIDNGIVNPNQIFVGQQLRIRPEGAPPPAPTDAPPTATPVPTITAAPGATSYTVQVGDTLFRIAMRFNTNVNTLVALNNLPNASVIYVGQTLLLPTGDVVPTPPAPTDALTQAPAVTPEVAATAVPVELEVDVAYGIEVFAGAEDAVKVAQQIAELGLDWVRVVVNWRDVEAAQGQLDFSTLDAIVLAMEAQDLDVLVTLTSAPAWARTSTDESGPPDDLATFATFAGQVADRYAGRVSAYEIWSEPNLRREWNSNVHDISASTYIELLRQAYAAIKAADPAAIVVSAGLAPTGFNDGVNAINDRVYLAALYAAGLADVSDAVGAHPGGWANPPDATCCAPAVGVETHYEDPSFYFLDTLADYREIMLQANDGGTSIWVTKFGWGSSEDMDPPSASYVYVTYTSLAEQAIYTPRAFHLGQDLGYVGPMFIYNLNGCQATGASAEPCYFSLIGPDGEPRPVFNAVQALDKSGEPAVDFDATAVPDTDPILLTATAIIESATQTAEAIEAAETETPEAEAPDVDPVLLTVTAIIETATAGQATEATSSGNG